MAQNVSESFGAGSRKRRAEGGPIDPRAKRRMGDGLSLDAVQEERGEHEG